MKKQYNYIKQLKMDRMNWAEGISEAGKDRLHPILMTAGTTVLSLVPLCVITTPIDGYGPPYFPMEQTIFGGLAFSTVVTLVILPTIYVMLKDLRIWARRVVGLVQ